MHAKARKDLGAAGELEVAEVAQRLFNLGLLFFRVRLLLCPLTGKGEIHVLRHDRVPVEHLGR